MIKKRLVLALLISLHGTFQLIAQTTLEQAYAEHTAGNLDKALELYTRVIAEEPGNLDAFWNRAHVYSSKENYAAAIADLLKVKEKAPDAPMVYNSLGWFQVLDNKILEGRKTLQQGLKLDSANYMFSVNIGHTYLLSGDATTARKYYAKTVRLFKAKNEFEGPKEDFKLFIKKGQRADLAQKELEWMTNEFNLHGKTFIAINGYTNEGLKAEVTDKDLAAAAGWYEKALREAVNTTGWDLVITNFRNVAYCYRELKLFDKGVSVGETATAYFRNKPFHAFHAEVAAETGYFHKQLRQLPKSETYYSEAIEHALKIKSDAMLNEYNNELGQIYDQLGRKEDAIKTYNLSIDAKRRMKDEGNLPITLNNLASVYNDLSMFDKALATFNEALTLATKTDQKWLIAIIKNGLGKCYQGTNNHEKALEMFKEALALDEAAGNEIKIAPRLNSVGTAYDGLKQYDKAQEYYDRALAKAKAVGDAGTEAIVYNNIAAVKDVVGQREAAIANYKAAIDLYQKINFQNEASLAMLNLSKILIDTDRYSEAGNYLALCETGIKNINNNSYTLEFLKMKAGFHLSQKQYPEAINYYEQVIQKTEQYRLNASGEARKTYLASQLIAYQALAAAHIYNQVPGSAIKAFNTIEQGRSKVLAERLSGAATATVPSTITIQDNMPGDAAFINFFAANTNPIMQVVITKDQVVGNTTFKDDVTKKILEKYEGEVNFVLQNQRGMKLVKSTAALNEDKDKANEKIENIIAYYRSLLMSTGVQEKRGFKLSDGGNKAQNAEKAKEVGKLLYQLLISPIEEFIVDKKELIVIPDGVLGYVPFETLIDGDGKYMVEKYHITYVQSATVLDLISKRNYPATRKPLLAFGGGVYDEVTYNTEMVTSQAEFAKIEKSAMSNIANRGSLREEYVKLGVGEWINLPGTLAEVQTIAKIVPGAETMTAASVSENKIKELSNSGALANYKVLHFATHGIVIPSIPELSALVLSQFKAETSKEDGYLNMTEIENLKIKADYVNLSACETGLGKVYGGEGVVGLTQAFLVAGAKGLSVSLWQVADESTSSFMTGLYDLSKGGNMSYARAITEMKRRFLKGEFGAENANPYFWAPFVYYGK